MKSENEIWKEACASSMNKWIRIIEDETEIVSLGVTPTQKMTDLIYKIKTAIKNGDSVDSDINSLIQDSFDQGVQNGFSKALSKFIDGSIVTKKDRNKDTYTLMTRYSTNQYQITINLPSAGESWIKTTSYIKLSDHGFE